MARRTGQGAPAGAGPAGAARRGARHRPPGHPASPDRIRAQALPQAIPQAIPQALPRAGAHADASYELGLLATRAGDAERAVPYFVAALRADPDRAHHWLALATALVGLDRVPEARAILERFLARGFADAATGRARGAFVETLFREAHALYLAGHHARAEARLDLVILLDERHAEAVHMAGNIAALTGRLDQAETLITIALGIDDGVAGYHANLGNVLSMRRRLPEAVGALERALALDPDCAQAHTNIGAVHHQMGASQRAIDHLRRALALDPAAVKAHSNLGVVLKEVGRVAEAIASYDRALALDPGFASAHSNRLFAKLYDPGTHPRDLLEDARDFGRRFAEPLRRRRPFANDRDPERRLRVGFVSADLREHAVNYFLEPALRGFDPARIETVAFSNTAVEDGATERLKGVFAAWHAIHGLDDEAAADLVEAEGIDVLVDLSGHTAGHRLLVFARKPAPVQVAWIGYPGTTGLTAIDYRLTDRLSEPEGIGDESGTEALWRLPRVGACYRANPECPAPSETPPCDANGYVTFGCFNRFTKVSDAALAAWARVLAAVPDARLLLEVADVEAPAVRADVEARLARAGLPLDRIDLEARSPRNRYVLYGRIDVALDPFPYNGGTTSFDTLWMGVPFVALEGDHYVARMGHSILGNLGLPELSTRSIDEYVALASDLARDRVHLRRLRSGLRARMAASPHMDEVGLARDVAEAFRGMWRRWLAAGGAANGTRGEEIEPSVPTSA